MDGPYTVADLAKRLSMTPHLLKGVLDYGEGKWCVRGQEPLERYAREEDQRWYVVDREILLQVYQGHRYGYDVLAMAANNAWGL